MTDEQLKHLERLGKGLDEDTGKPGNFIHISRHHLAEAVLEIKRLRRQLARLKP